MHHICPWCAYRSPISSLSLHPTVPHPVPHPLAQATSLPDTSLPCSSVTFLLSCCLSHPLQRPAHPPCIRLTHQPRGARRRSSHHRDLRTVVPTRSHHHPFPRPALLSVVAPSTERPESLIHSHSPTTRVTTHHAPHQPRRPGCCIRSLHPAASSTLRCNAEPVRLGPPGAYEPVVSIPINTRSVTSIRPQPNPISPPPPSL